MLIDAVEQDAENRLITFIKSDNASTGGWGIIAVRRQALNTASNDSFLLALKPALQDASRATIYFTPQTIYVAWTGMRRHVEARLRTAIGSLVKDDTAAADPDIFKYIDPAIDGNELIVRIKAELSETRPQAVQNVAASDTSVLIAPKHIPLLAGDIGSAQFRDLMERKRGHAKLSVLVIEDQPFLRRLIFEVLQTSHEINMASGIREGLDVYLKEAPHVVFLDIGLPDGSGHVLAKKLREIDPTSYVVMVTGSRQMEDVTAAKTNGVHGFILKPFSKGKILDALQAYRSAFPNLISKGA